MATYLIGDLQGCHACLLKLLQKIEFSPHTDTVYLLGDLVNRGPQSLQALRYCRDMQGSIQVLLGNHDLHLLACALAHGRPGRKPINVNRGCPATPEYCPAYRGSSATPAAIAGRD